MTDKIHFGPGCSTIEVDPFEPICSYPEPQKSAASTFEVPIPASVPPVPPSECVCFDFESEEVEVTTAQCDQPAKCSVEIAPVGDCCDGVYKVTPHIEVPCIPFDIAPAVVTTTVAVGTTPKASFRLEKDCFGCKLKPFLDIEFPIPKIDIPIPCFRVEGDGEGGATFGLTINYTTGGNTVTASAAGKGGRDRAKAAAVTPHTVTANFTVGRDPDVGDCDCYKIGSATIDLGNLGGGGFDNGGDVNLNDENKLEIDGKEADTQVWYEGGIGDLATDAPTYLPLKRGPGYMNGMGPSSYGKSGKIAIPYVEFTNQQRFLNARSTTAMRWSSRRPSGIAPGIASGNLDIVAPAGFQWHDRGIAAVMGHWRYNQSGVLSWYESAKGAALLSPAPATIGNKAASGLGFFPADAWDNRNPGLAVNAGIGLRIYGIGDPSVPSGDGDPTGVRQGQLEVQYGKGLAIDGAASVGATHQSEAVGALTVALAEGGGLTFDKNGRITLSDDDGFAKKDHAHGNIDKDGCLANGASANKIVITDGNNKITWDSHLTVKKLAAVLDENTITTGSGATSSVYDGIVTQFIVRHNSTSAGSAITLNESGETIQFGSGTTASTISTGSTATLTVRSNTGITLNAPMHTTTLENPPTWTKEQASGKNDVATCGWVADHFGAGGDVETVASVSPVKGDVRKSDLVTALKGKEANTLAEGNHAHGNIKSDGTLNQASITDGDVVIVDRSGKFSAGLGLADIVDAGAEDDAAILAAMEEVCTYTRGTGTARQQGVMANNVVDTLSAGTADHLAYFKFDNSREIGKLTALTDLDKDDLVAMYNAVMITDSETGDKTMSGIKRSAFGASGTEKSRATVVFQENEDTATLIDGVPLTEDGTATENGEVMAIAFDDEDDTPYLTPTGFKWAPGSDGTSASDKKGYVLTADGEGSADWKAVSFLRGEGFRQRKVDASGKVTYDTTKSTADGAIDINYGRGLHITSGCSKADRDNKVEIHATEGEFTFFGPQKDSLTDAKLAIDDANQGGAIFPWSAPSTWTRNSTVKKELFLRFVVDLEVDPSTGLQYPRYGYARFLANGVLLSYKLGPDAPDESVQPAELDTGRSTKPRVTECGN